MRGEFVRKLMILRKALIEGDTRKFCFLYGVRLCVCVGKMQMCVFTYSYLYLYIHTVVYYQ